MSESLNIAIIGGGAAGLITGYLLSENHEVTIFERQPELGGNVRTLNRNVKGTPLPKGTWIENGVLGFSQVYYPNFHKLLDRLGTPYRDFNPSVSLFADGAYYPADSGLYRTRKLLTKLITNASYRSNVMALRREQKSHFLEAAQVVAPYRLFSDYTFKTPFFRRFLQALYSLSFSTPTQHVAHLPQSMLSPYLLALPNSTWSAISGGVYRYMEDILAQARMTALCGIEGLKLYRGSSDVTLQWGGQSRRFDKVVVTTTPGRVKDLIGDPTHEETAVFWQWRDQDFSTLAHTDLSPYGEHRGVHKTPMDLFDRYRGQEQGYNTYMNDFYRLSPNVPYSFAYGLNDLIDPSKILHKVSHTVPYYASDHEHKVSRIGRINGLNHTFYAGAYLDNGLHEGAVNSALSVSRSLGGTML